MIKALTVLNSENDVSEDECCYNKVAKQAAMSETVSPFSDADMVSFCYQIAHGMVSVL